MLIYQIAHSQKSKKEEKASFGCSLIHIHLFFIYFILHCIPYLTVTFIQRSSYTSDFLKKTKPTDIDYFD